MNEYFKNPRNLFLFDGFGALVSAFSLGVLLVIFESYIGMPRKTLYFLALLPCLFFIYDFYCYFQVKENWRPFLKGIAFANLGYCFLSMGLIYFHYRQLTNLGLTYFLLELIVLMVFIIIEFQVASK